MTDIKISGFDYGMYMPYSSVTVMDKIDISENRIAGISSTGSRVVCKEMNSGNIPAFAFFEGDENGGIYKAGLYYFLNENISCAGTLYDNKVYYEQASAVRTDRFIPENHRSLNKEDWVCVDDFGAVGDGITDSTNAIQAAFNSGREIVIFGSGHYFVNGEITVPATVKTIDFMYCDFFSGEKLVNAENGALFNINEDSEDLLFMENVYTFEQFYGRLRLIKHSAKRDLVMKNIHTQASATYFNTVSGSKVYMDNCAATTGTYSHNCVLTKLCEYDNYSDVIPYEFHGQTVYGMQVNPERADIEMLNDNSVILMDAYKVEGPGAAVKTINNGKTQINICTCAIGYNKAENALFLTEDAELILNGVLVQDMPGWGRLSYGLILEQNINGTEKKVYAKELEDRVDDISRRINHYDSGDFESLS